MSDMSTQEAEGPVAEAQFLDLLAHGYLEYGHPHKAAVLLAARDALIPGDARVLLALALAQVRSQQEEQALGTLERLALMGIADAHFHLLRAQALAALGRSSEAAAAMRAYVALCKQDTD